MGVILCEFESRPPHKSLVERSGFFRVCSNRLFARKWLASRWSPPTRNVRVSNHLCPHYRECDMHRLQIGSVRGLNVKSRAQRKKSRATRPKGRHPFQIIAQQAARTSRLLSNRTTVTEIGSFITRWSPKHYKSTLINDHRDTFLSKYVTVVKDIIALRRLDVNRETVILYASLYAFYP